MIAWMAAAAVAMPPPRIELDEVPVEPPASTLPCPVDGMADGPVVAGLLDGNLGRARRACVRDEVGVTVGGLLVADTPNFYGHLVGGLTLDGSLAVDDRTEVFATLELFRYDSVISALTSTYTGLGHTGIGASRVLTASDRGVLALNGKVVLPTAFGLYRNSWPFGVDLGLAGAWQAHDVVRLHGQIGALASAAASRGASQPRLGAMTTVGAELRPGRAFAVVADLASGFGYTAPLDVVSGALGLRFSDGKRWGLEIGGTVPFAGRERATAAVDVRNTVRLGPIREGAVGR